MANKIPHLPQMPWSGRAAQQNDDPEHKIRFRRHMRLLVGNTIALLALYFVVLYLGFWQICIVYTVLAAILTLGYVIYNRGFVYKNATPAMLPDTLSNEQKAGRLADAKARDQRSRWLLTLIFPLVLSVLLDLFFTLFLADLLEKWNAALFMFLNYLP